MLLTQQQVEKLIQEAPQGVEAREVVMGLIRRGHTIEGLDVGQKDLPQEQKEPGFFSFAGKSVLGTAEEKDKPQGLKGFAADIFESTLGEKGASGFLRSPAEGLAAKKKAQTAINVEEARKQLADSTFRISNQLRNFPDGPNKEQLMRQVQQNYEFMNQLRGESGQLLDESQQQNFSRLAEQAANTVLTLGLGPVNRSFQTVGGRVLGTSALGAGREVIANAPSVLGLDEEDKINWSQYLQKIGVGAGVGVVAGSAGEAIRKGFEAIPRLLSYTSDVPQAALERIQSQTTVSTFFKDIGTGARNLFRVGRSPQTFETQLKLAQEVVRGMRKVLSGEYDDSLKVVVDAFPGRRVGLSEKESSILQRIVDQFGIETPQDLTNMSVNESVGLIKEINSLYSKRAVSQAAEGVIVRNFRNSFRKRLIDTYGGKDGVLHSFWRNYASKKQIIDASDEIVRAYQTRSPMKATSALNRIKDVFNENKPAFLDAMLDLEQKSGVDILTGLSKAATDPFLPIKSGKFTFEDLFRAILFPLTSPRMVRWWSKSGKELMDFSQKTGTATALKVMFMNALLGEKTADTTPLSIQQ